MTCVSELVRLGTVKKGRENKWQGASGFVHQIDVSLESDEDVLLVECKHWKDNVTAEVFLTLWARVLDLSKGPESKGRRIMGALVTSRGFQSGVDKLADYYKEHMSAFFVTADGEFKIKSYTAFIYSSSIPSGETFGIPSIIVQPPPRS
jgi:hypothetical protein